MPVYPRGPLADKWTSYKSGCKLVNPNNKRKLDILVIGTGLAGASAAATLGQLGYNVKVFCYQDTPRRAHSIAAQGGINAAKNYQTMVTAFTACSTTPSRAAIIAPVKRTFTVSLLSATRSSISVLPRAYRSPGSTAACFSNRSFGGAQVSRTFYARGQTGQQLLLGAYSALSYQIAEGNVTLYHRRDVLDMSLLKERREASLSATWSPERLRAISVMPSCWPTADTATCSSCRPTPWVRT